MKEILITSSVLILAVMLLRLIFRGKVSQKLIYGAWLLVALRLLVPVQFGSFDFSILNQAEPVTQIITEVSKNPVAGPSREEVYQQIAQDYLDRGEHIFIPEVEEKLESEETPSYEEIFQEYPIQSIVIPEVNTQIQQEVDTAITAPTVGQIATAVWIVGMAAMALWFVFVNLRFHRALRRSAQIMDAPDSPIPVMVDATLPSPCLFGFFRPTVYLTPVCTADETHLRHVLTHELTHYAHKDHIWSLVRCVCLCVYWFNPLVWVAAGLAKRDCELACDEAVLKKLGDEERISYGKTLVDMVANSTSPAHYLETATAMHENKEQLAERISRIICKPKFLLTAAITLLLVLGVVTGCAFAGPVSRTMEPPATTVPTTPPTTTTVPPKTTAPPTTEPPVTSEPALEFSPKGTPLYGDALQALKDMVEHYDSWYARATTSFYGNPMDVNLCSTFREAFGLYDDFTDAETVFLQNTHFGKYIGYMSFRKLPVTEIDQILRQYFGVTFAQTSKTGTDAMAYFDDTDCYYYANNGSGDVMPKVDSAYIQGNGTIHMYYDLTHYDYLPGIPDCVMVLHPMDSGYRILANQKIENFQPDPETYAKYLVPDIPVTPESAEAGNVVYPNYSTTVQWLTKNGDTCTVSIRLPALSGSSEGAKAINADILRRYSSKLQSIRSDYLGAFSPAIRSIEYDSWQVGNIVTVAISGSSLYLDVTSFYHLDISTGKWLTDTELTGMSHAETLYRQCRSLPSYHINTPSPDACSLSNTMYMDKNGQLWLLHHCVAPDWQTVDIPFDPNAGELSSLEDIYHWLFHIESDGAFTTMWYIELRNCFASNPIEFVRMLSKEDDDTISHVAWMCHEMTIDELPNYISSCTFLANTADSDREKQTAQALLDRTVEVYHLDKLDACSELLRKIVDTETAETYGKELYDLFAGDMNSFMNHMQIINSAFYPYYCSAILPHTNAQERAKLTTICKLNAEYEYSENVRLAAEAMLSALRKYD